MLPRKMIWIAVRSHHAASHPDGKNQIRTQGETTAKIDANRLSIAYEIIGTGGKTIAIAPGVLRAVINAQR
jgi:hypothetical protein